MPTQCVGQRLLSVWAAVGLVLIAPVVVVAPAVAGPPAPPPLAVEVLTAPQPVPATDWRTHLVYEILLRNDADHAVRLDRVEVRARGILAVLGGDAIEDRLFRFADGVYARTLPPGGSGMLLLDVVLAPGVPVPVRVDHRFGVATGTGDDSATFTGAPTTVDRREPLRVSAPLRGGGLAVFGCCGPPFGHRRARVELDGRLYLAQRFAVDFVRMDAALNTNAGDPTRNDSYYIFGAEVMAAAPGRVLAVRDGVAENTPLVFPDLGDNDALGNFVLQDLGGGRTAVYAHLRTGSVRVRPGDRLDRGQVLGQVGNSGNSFQPHLHFQVTDAPGLPSGLTANGVPFVFDRFRLDSRVAGYDILPPVPVRIPVSPPHRRAGQYLLNGDIVTFEPSGDRR